MASKTYKCGENTVTVDKGRITEATLEYFRSGPDFRIGSKITATILGGFGYRLVKTPRQVDVWGRKIG